MITREEADRLRDQLLAVMAEDAHNADRLVSRLDAISQESGIGAHAALLLILTRLAFDDREARGHWESILAHQRRISEAIGREVGVRVAVLDYFMNVNRRLVQPTLIDLELLESADRFGPVDSLTGLANDRAFRASVQSELRRAKRYGLSVAVVLFDLDDFARVNDGVGQLVGDRILKETAILLSNKVRDIDLAARPGEDELALVLPQTDRNGALLVAERFRREVESHGSRREARGRPLRLTVSGGLACYPSDASAPEALLERAAQALYQAKASGKNSIQVYRPERRRFLRFDLEPERFEIEVLAPKEVGRARARNLSRNGILFESPEPLEVGEEIEIRLLEPAPGESPSSLRVRGCVVRLEELPRSEGGGSPEPAPAAQAGPYEVGVAFTLDPGGGEQDLAAFLESARSQRAGLR